MDNLLLFLQLYPIISLRIAQLFPLINAVMTFFRVGHRCISYLDDCYRTHSPLFWLAVSFWLNFIALSLSSESVMVRLLFPSMEIIPSRCCFCPACPPSYIHSPAPTPSPSPSPSASPIPTLITKAKYWALFMTVVTIAVYFCRLKIRRIYASKLNNSYLGRLLPEILVLVLTYFFSNATEESIKGLICQFAITLSIFSLVQIVASDIDFGLSNTFLILPLLSAKNIEGYILPVMWIVVGCMYMIRQAIISSRLRAIKAEKEVKDFVDLEGQEKPKLYTKMERRIEVLEKDLYRSTVELNDAKFELTKANKTITELEDRVHVETGKKSDLLIKNATLENAFSSMKKDLEEAREKLNDTESKLTNANETITELKDRVHVETKKKSDLLIKNATLENALSSMKKDLGEVREKLNDTESKLTNAKLEEKDFQCEKSFVGKQVERLNGQIKKHEQSAGKRRDSAAERNTEVLHSRGTKSQASTLISIQKPKLEEVSDEQRSAVASSGLLPQAVISQKNKKPQSSVPYFNIPPPPSQQETAYEPSMDCQRMGAPSLIPSQDTGPSGPGENGSES